MKKNLEIREFPENWHLCYIDFVQFSCFVPGKNICNDVTAKIVHLQTLLFHDNSKKCPLTPKWMR